jgi:hypothetical protein
MICIIKKSIACCSAMVVLFFFNPLLGMDAPKIMDNASTALSVMLTHIPHCFDHAMICSLAINKEYEQVLRNTAQSRKAFITKRIQKGQIFDEGSGVWHKYGSACGARDDWGSYFSLKCVFLGCGDINVRLSSGWNNPEKYVLGFEKVQFSGSGDLCFYGCGTDSRRGWGKHQNVIEYCLPKQGSSVARRCVLALKKNAFIDYAFPWIVPFPALLKALLNSSVVTEDYIDKKYSLEDAIIPDNYQECDVGESFEDLPEELKEAIVKRYNEQSTTTKI